MFRVIFSQSPICRLLDRIKYIKILIRIFNINHLGNAANQNRRHGHDNASEGGEVREDLGGCGGLAAEHPLEVDLPGDASEGEQKEVVGIVKVPPASANFSKPSLCPVRHFDLLHGGVNPGERDTDPLKHEQD